LSKKLDFIPNPLKVALINNLIFNKSPLEDLGVNDKKGAFETAPY
jgi:hypothetical protein